MLGKHIPAPETDNHRLLAQSEVHLGPFAKKSIAENREKQEDSLQIQIPLIKAELFV